MNKTFYLVRHGLATKSLFGYGNNIFAATLLPDHTAPIKRIGSFLAKIPTDYNASSEFPRCRQTADIISKKTGRQFFFDNRLNEYHPKSREPFSVFNDRLKNFLGEIKSKKEKHILIVTHGAVIAGLKHLILSNRFWRIHLFDFPKTGSLVIIKNGETETLDFN